MPSRKNPSKFTLMRLVFLQEIRSLLIAPSLWIMLIIISLLLGYSFYQALALFSQASKTALSFPEMASGMNPLEGIFVPTFGAYYLSQTLLLPFVAIRLIGLDKQSGALKLLLQLPLSAFTLCGLKVTAMGFIWLLSLLPAISAILVWQNLGGHLYLPEIFLLLAGHGLYSLTVITIAMFAATVSDSLPTAAMFCLAATLGSWVLDFAAAGQTGLLATFGHFSLTAMLHQFESGLLASPLVVSFFALSLLFFLLTVIWLHPGQRNLTRLKHSLATLICISLTIYIAALTPHDKDVTENRRHSFNPADSRALQSLHEPLTITIHLDPQDSRLLDMERDIFAKLKRNVPKLTMKYIQNTTGGLFNAATDDKYGLIIYEYNGQRSETYSNSQQEILPIIYKLANIEVHPDSVPIYHGHPLVAVAGYSKWWFYIVLPFLFLCAAIAGRRGKW